ncbi:tRNA1(Val) (adenine(37)-N6)-methyltransferase [Polycladidibacter hongkongensis]|uniref:tRNA1(Val) (adenine(37)-N6)-methyltransferase n=1 Tax=Polycladidibacter hongkongensis TaxID=1647556 RepID=UPI0008346AF5|nr:methyltransferase [Pseudovibrio hongkongensis]
MSNVHDEGQADAHATTRDNFLGGRVLIEQPAKGTHRAGIDAVLLAAALPNGTKGHLLDLGAGVGTAGFCAAWRLPELQLTSVELDNTAANLARKALTFPQNASFADRVSVLEADITAKGDIRHASGLAPNQADHVIINPPYYAPQRFRITPKQTRADAHALDDRGLEPWIKTAKDILRDKGSLTIIFRADGLADILPLMQGRFGGITIRPIHPTADKPANLILISAIAASKAPLGILPPLVLRNCDNTAYTEQVEGILRHGRGL